MAIDAILQPNDAEDEATGQKDPISIKKLLKGDGAWETTKTVLGWLIDAVAGTIELLPHHQEWLHSILAEFPHSRWQAGMLVWQKLLGEL